MTAETQEGWPPNVERIGIDDLKRLGINGQQQLFWDGRRIEVRRRLDLTNLEKALATIVTVCAILGALGSFITGFNNGSVFLCARGVHWLSCPLHTPDKR
ncbi:hypothetical protein [Acidisoma cladoniae]|jgi:hypothetical protein|uniref:hypothetical protein n=1 Tax=Acidisoma cladoniae TaxID=3040935 RepID=UPI00254AD140|nr:hypothetical protein [Acidisoma sp. PAMC 29798]